MKNDLPFSPPLNKEEVMEELSNYKKLNYNQFRWWRMYDYPRKPLSVKRDIKDRIRNGDFERSVYAPQIWLVEHQLNDLFSACKDIDEYREKASIHLSRRMKLQEDLHIDETARLLAFTNSMINMFEIDKEEVFKEAEKCEGEIVDLYFQIAQKYKRRKNVKGRGRPKKSD